MTDFEASNAVTITATAGRDTGKNFKVLEIAPVETATFVLRLLAAIRLGGVDELMALLAGERDSDNETDIGAVLRLLAGCDPAAVRSLMTDALSHVLIAPDVQHPGMFRQLRDDDIKEMATLGNVLAAFVRVNVMPGA